MILIMYLVFINVVTLLLYGLDKWKAKHGRFRIPEKVLLLFAVIGGAIGAFFGMYFFRHKIRKNKFRLTVPILFLIEALLIVFCLYQNHHIVVTTYSEENSRLPDGMDGFRIVQISDLHNQFFGFHEKHLLNRIKQCDPDFEIFPALSEGVHRKGRTTMVISRGMGNSIIPIRINNYPEIVVVELKKDG
ncbi:MAG: DUF1294 domain-containing protein [Lachnospiraceae bacterium]|nr:DUF1294 domain-containing protein [Lachnospiraceae bacterium]